MQGIERDVRRISRDVNPRTASAQLKKLLEGLERQSLIPRTDEEVSAMAEMNQLATQLQQRERDAQQMEETCDRLKGEAAEAAEKLGRVERDLAQIKTRLDAKEAEAGTAADKARKAEEQLRRLRQDTDDKIKRLGEERDQLKSKVAQMEKEQQTSKSAVASAGPTKYGERKKSVKFALEDLDDSEDSNSSRVKELEKKLDAANKERQDILQAAEKEIEYHRSIACELEQTMLEDFEWKIHEIEADFHRKLKDAVAEAAANGGATVAEPSTSAFSRTSTTGAQQRKDEDMARLQTQMRREMDEKLRAERNSLKESLGNCYHHIVCTVVIGS